MKHSIFTLLICIFISFSCFSQNKDKESKTREKEIEKLLSKMTIKEMVGQLIMIGADTEVNKK